MKDSELIFTEYLAGHHTVKEANKLLSALPKPWHSKEWKEKRALLLKSNCEDCGSSENLVLQHTWQPPKWRNLRAANNTSYMQSALFLKDALAYYEKNQTGFKEWLAQKKEANKCPKCLRKTQVFKSGKIYCAKCKKHYKDYELKCSYRIQSGSFITNISKNYPENYTEEDLKLFISIFYAETNYSEIKDYLDHLTFKESYLNHLRYMSMMDTKTSCKICAAKEDWHFFK